MVGTRSRGSAPGTGEPTLLATVGLLVVPAVVVAATYLWIYASHRFVFPVGYDTPKYLWRSSLVGAQGLHALAGSVPAPFRANPDRPGFPILVSAVASLLRVSVP